MRGAKIKSYEVWGQLSRGGMSDVWLARHAELALPVIIKTLLQGSHESTEVRYRTLLQEARLTARLTSPRVVRVIDVGIDERLGAEAMPFLVEEYVDGIDLAEFDRRRRNALRRPLPLWAVADLLSQAADGLHAAHQAGVIHCDVKPSNLFGHSHGSIKVGDFGVAVAAAGAERAAPVGTPLFMAPEQLMGERIDRRADVYALGASAFALRYGTSPYASPADAVCDDAVPRFPPARSPEEAYFQHVVARMLARQPDARYANMTPARHYFRVLVGATVPRIAPTRVAPAVFELGRARVSFEIGDLSVIETDAVVNSAHSDMRMDSSLGRALRARGGVEIENEAITSGEHALGDCIATGAGRLPCRGVLHAVGGWNEVSCVARATQRALLLAEEKGYARIALPAIATGTNAVSIESSADAMVGAVKRHLALGGSHLRELRFVLYDTAIYSRFLEVATGLLLGTEESFRLDEGDESDAAARIEREFAQTFPLRTPTVRTEP